MRNFLLIQILIYICFQTSIAQLTVSFGTTPAATSGSINICAEGSVIFTSTSQNVPSGATINWTFPGGSPASASTIGPHAVTYSTPGTYTATLTINGQSTNVSVSVAPNSGNPSFEIESFLTNFGYSQDTSANGLVSIYYCGNQFGIYNGNIQFNMSMDTYPADHQIIVNWGDGSSNVYAGTVGVVSHIYDCSSVNQFTASVSVVSPAGCVTAGLFNFYSGAPPQIFITNNLSTHCLPEPYDFTFNANDIPGTTYEYIFSNPSSTLTTISGPFPVNIEHDFVLHSCTQTATIQGPDGSLIPYSNAYSASFIATNLCGSSFTSIGPIYVSQMPTTAIMTEPEDIACVGQEVTISNESLLGMMTGPSGCNPLNKFYWTITPSTGYSINNGALGNGTNPNWFFWEDGSEELVVTFNDYGTYYFELIQANACGTDTIMDSICIVAPIEADFTTNLNSGCSPLQITTTNSPYIPSCVQNSALYNWSVTSTGNGTCPSEGVLPSYAGGTNPNSFQPQFVFNNPGIYDVQLISSLTNPLIGTLCQADTSVVQITVTQGPNISFTNYAVCENETIVLNNTVDECYSTNSFEWSFPSPPASISSSTTQEPFLSFSQPGTHPISVTITNACGSETFPSNVLVYPTSSVVIAGPNGACVGNPISITATIGGVATEGVWSVTPNIGNFSNNTALSTTYIPSGNFVGPLIFTFTTTNAPAECGQVSQTFLVQYEQNATANAGSYAPICEDNTLQLNGAIGGAASSAAWSDNVGGSFSSTVALDAVYTPPAGYIGSVVLTLLTNDPPGTCEAAQSTTTLNIVPGVDLTSVVPSVICQGGSIAVSSVPSGTFTGVQWSASIGSFANATQQNTSYTPPANFSGPIDITVSTTGSTPCPAATQTSSIIVEPTATIANSSTTICSGASFNFIPSNIAPNSIPINTGYVWTVVPNANIVGATSNNIPGAGINQTLSSNSLVPQTVVYNIEPISIGNLACNGPAFTLSVTVLPTPSLDPIPDAGFCAFLPVNINFTGVANAYSWTSAGDNIGIAANGTGNVSFTAQNAGSTNLSSTVTVTPIFTLNGVSCTGNSQSFQINVTPAPTVNLISDVEVCNGGTVPQINFTASLPGSTFAWTNSSPAIGLVNSGNTQINSFTANNNTLGMLTGNISVIANANGCPGPATTFTINVLPVVSITNVSNSQTVCNGGASTAVAWTSNAIGLTTTYSWNIVNTGATITGFTASGTGNLPSFNLNNNNNTQGQLVITVIPSVNGCPGNSFNYTINVNPTPVLSAIAAQTICGGQTFTTPLFNSTVAGTTFSWALQNSGSVPGTITGFPTTGTGNMNGVAVLNSGTQPYTLVYTVTPTANGCDGIAQNFSLTVNPSPDVLFSEIDQTICSGQLSTAVNLSSNTLGVNFNWNVVAPAGITGLNTLSGTTNIPVFTLTNSTNAPITIIFQAQATTTGANACPGPIYEYEITVNHTPSITPIANQVYCNTDNANGITITGTGTSYSWTSTPNNVGLAASGVENIPVFIASNNTNAPLQSVIEIVPTYTNNGVSCNGTSTSFTILVNPAAQVNGIADVLACNGANVDPILFSTNNTGGTSAYSWTNNQPAIGLSSSQNNVNQTPGFIATNNLGVVNTGIVTVTPSYTNGGLTCSGPTTNFEISVLPTPTVNAMADLSYCSGTTTNAISFTGTATQYNWTNSNTVIGLGANNTGNIPGFVATNPSNDPISGTIAVFPEFTFNGLTCSGASESFVITVNTGPEVNPVNDTVVCNGENISEVVFSGNANLYTWTMTGDNVGTAASGTGNIPAFTALSGATTVHTANFTVTPAYDANGFVCTGAPTSFSIVVNPTPFVNPTSDITACHSTAQALINFGGNATNYSWSASNTSVGLSNASGINNIPAFTTFNLQQGINNTSTITVTPEFVANGLTCFGTPDVFDITVLYVPIVDPIANQELCNGTFTNAISFTGNGTSYNWLNNNPSIYPSGTPSGTGNIASFQATNNGSVAAQGIFTVTPIYTENNVSCSGLNSNFTIQVNPTPSVSPIADVVVCNQATTNQINISGTGTSYSWTNSNTSIGLSGSGGNFIPSFVGQNSSNSIINQGSITVVPAFDGQGTSCPGIPLTFEFIINPTPIVDAVANQTICFGSSSTEVVLSGTGTSYNWTNSNASVWSTLNGTDIVPTFNGGNSSSAPISATFTVTPIFTTNNVNCPGPAGSFSIAVLPQPSVTQVAPQSICNNTLFTGQTYSGTYTEVSWLNATLGTGLPSNGNGNLPSFTGTNSSNTTPLVSNIEVTPSYIFNGLTCIGNPMNHSVSVLPTTIIENIPDVVYCNGDATTAIPIVSGATSVSWNSSQASIGLATGTAFTIPSFTATNTNVSVGATSVTSTVTINPTYTDAVGTVCAGTPNSFDITVNPTPVITEIANYTVCNNGAVSQFLTTNIPSDVEWSSSFNPNITGNSTALQSSNLINNNLSNSSMTPQTTIYTANATSSPAGCPSAPMDFVINLMPDVVMLSQNNFEICTGTSVAGIFESNVPASFNWFGTTTSGVTGISTSMQTSGAITDTPINTSGSPQLVIYNVTPTSLDGSCVGQAQIITVLVNPPPALVSASTASVCSESPINYNFVANQTALFNWYGLPNPNIQGISTSIQQNSQITDVLVNNSGIPQSVTYFVTITSIADDNCTSPAIPITITVNPLPVVVPQTLELCTGSQFIFNLEASEPSSFQWIGVNNINVNGETLTLQSTNLIQNTLTNSTFDIQNVFYNVIPTSSSSGCVGYTVQHSAIVNPLPNLNFNLTGFLCSSNPISVVNNTPLPINSFWDFGNNTQSIDYNPEISYSTAGDYIITYYGFNPATGCENTITTPINIGQAPPVDFAVNVTEGCVPALFEFQNTAENPGSILQWNFGDSTISNEQGLTDHFYTEAGCYDVTLTATAPNGCPNSITYEDLVCAYNIPIAGFIVNDPIQYSDVNEFIFENVSQYGSTYFWDLGDGTVTNAVSPGHIYPIERNIYQVMLVATNEAGCSDTTYSSVQVKERLIFYVPNSFTPDGNSRNEFFQAVFTAGYERNSFEMLIYNRSGEVMFESYNDQVGWPGTYGGQIVQEGTYIWKIRFRLLDDSEYQEYYGHINVLK